MADSDNVLEAREMGVETQDCPNCGKSLNLVENADGSVAYESCSKCYPQASKKAAREQAEAQEAGVLPRETGTNTEEN